MSKRKIMIGIFSAVILTISVSFAEAQVPKVPTPTAVPDAAAERAPTINTPREACQYYDNRWERAIYIGAVRPPTDNDCLYKITDGENIGYIHAYYSGNKFCVNSYGAFFHNAGGSTECKVVSQIGKGQQPKTSPKVVKPVPQNIDKNAGKSNSSLFDYLAENINIIINDIIRGFRNIFDGFRNLF